jgi:alkylhydroperoxidase family enzyme
LAWISGIDDREWSDHDGLAELYGKVVDPTYGRVDNIMQVHSLDPGSLEAHLVLYRQAMRSTSTLRKVDRELVAYVVSSINECHY